MRVGIIELICDTAPTRGPLAFFELALCQQTYSIMPQVVAVWCRRRGHAVCYRTYYGQSSPEHLLPSDLDCVFISAHTASSALAYALSALLRRRGTRTILGGPHAAAFGVEALPYFDAVVSTCNEDTVDRLVKGDMDGGVVDVPSSEQIQIPSVAERWDDISVAAFRHGAPRPYSVISIYASLGCPYRCDFCVDWKSTYRPLARNDLLLDLKTIRTRAPGNFIAFHDPNFGIKFDDTLDCIEEAGEERCNPYGMEASLSILKSGRLDRLRRTNCVFIPTGVESWSDYNAKVAVKSTSPEKKFAEIAAHFRLLEEHIPYLQANFILGLDNDRGEAPFELTRRFVQEFPSVFPAVNVPIPYGGTPMFDRMTSEGRVLGGLPSMFFFAPMLVLRMQNYEPVEYLRRMRSLYRSISGVKATWSRVQRGSLAVRVLNAARGISVRSQLRRLAWLEHLATKDVSVRRFYDGKSTEVPGPFAAILKARLGPYFDLLGQRA
jgi:radical SAM superfamily enzyme YgiQ (UPF0313 family)